MKDAYLNTLRPMDGQQADPPEPKRETTPVVDKKQLSLCFSPAEKWVARYNDLDYKRKLYAARAGIAPSKAQRDFWRRAVARTNAELDAHVENRQG